MIIYFEIAVLVGVFILALVAMKTFGKPAAEAYLEKTRMENQELGSGKTQKLEKRVEELENRIEGLNEQILNLQESLEFTTRLVEKSNSESLNIKEKAR